jgi:hypothetical protein
MSFGRTVCVKQGQVKHTCISTLTEYMSSQPLMDPG